MYLFKVVCNQNVYKVSNFSRLFQCTILEYTFKETRFIHKIICYSLGFNIR